MPLKIQQEDLPRSWSYRRDSGLHHQGLSPKYKENTQMRNRSLKCMAIAVLALTGVATLSAQQLTQAEKEHALQYLEATKQDVLDATKGLSQAQWNFKPAPDRWSVAQVMEHIAAAEDFIRVNLVQDKVMTLPAGELAIGH